MWGEEARHRRGRAAIGGRATETAVITHGDNDPGLPPALMTGQPELQAANGWRPLTAARTMPAPCARRRLQEIGCEVAAARSRRRGGGCPACRALRRCPCQGATVRPCASPSTRTAPSAPSAATARCAAASRRCLLSNALKYKRAGGRVSVQLESGAKRWRLAVDDHGPGQLTERRARRFLPFSASGRPAWLSRAPGCRCRGARGECSVSGRASPTRRTPPSAPSAAIARCTAASRRSGPASGRCRRPRCGACGPR